MKIWKEILTIAPYQDIRLPINAILLSIQTQNENPTVWFSFDEEVRDTEERRFFILMTGHSAAIPPAARYLGTFQVHGGQFVGHVYYI